MADDLTSAKGKLRGNDGNSVPRFNFYSLPLNDLSPLWDRIEARYSLTLAELSALQNARYQQGYKVRSLLVILKTFSLFIYILPNVNFDSSLR
jgi:hypothetical protein